MLRELSSFLVAFYTFFYHLCPGDPGHGFSREMGQLSGRAAMHEPDSFPFFGAVVLSVFPDIPLVQTGAQGDAGADR